MNYTKKAFDWAFDAPTPMIRPRFNISDVILIKNALELIKPNLIPELQARCDFIIKEILQAEKDRWEQNKKENLK